MDIGHYLLSDPKESGPHLLLTRRAIKGEDITSKLTIESRNNDRVLSTFEDESGEGHAFINVKGDRITVEQTFNYTPGHIDDDSKNTIIYEGSKSSDGTHVVGEYYSKLDSVCGQFILKYHTQ